MQEADLRGALCRTNSSLVAHGYLRRCRFANRFWFLSPDWAMWFIPTTISLILGVGSFASTADVTPLWEQLIFVAFVVCAFVASFLVTCTDPGVYPRLSVGERDPLDGASFVTCKVCGVKRPPRSAHCYICGVCVLDHDHHCGVIGGCVGMRSLRWFTLYLVSISIAAIIALCWLLLRILQVRGKVRQEAGTKHPNGAAMATNIILLVFVANVVLLVGGLACYYMYLMATDTTRREAQGKQRKNLSPSEKYLCWHLWRSMFPPASLLCDLRRPEDKMELV